MFLHQNLVANTGLIISGYSQNVGFVSFALFVIAVLCAVGIGGYTIGTSIIGMLSNAGSTNPTKIIIPLIPKSISDF